MTTRCNGCGRCCDPVMLPYGPIDGLMAPPGAFTPADRAWFVNDLTPISRREGLARADFLTQGGRTVIGLVPDDGGSMVIFSFFYECRWFDKDTRECTNYDGRPPICSGYPWYDDGPDSSKAIPFECSFNADVGKPVKPMPVTIRRG